MTALPEKFRFGMVPYSYAKGLADIIPISDFEGPLDISASGFYGYYTKNSSISHSVNRI